MIRLDDGPWCFLCSFVLLQSVCFSLKIFAEVDFCACLWFQADKQTPLTPLVDGW